MDDIVDGDLPDDDPEVIAGMKRLRLLRELEREIRDITPPKRDS